MCLFFITASFVSCWKRPDPLEMPGEIFIGAGFDAAGSTESGAPQKTSSEAPKKVVENEEQPEKTITDEDSDAIPEDITPSDDPKDITEPKDKKPTPQELAKIKKDAEDKAKKDAEKLAKQEEDRLAKIEADRLAKLEAERIAEEERMKALLGGGGNSNTSGTVGDGGKDKTGTGGNATKGNQKGSPSGWKRTNSLPSHVNITVPPGRKPVITIRYTIDSNGNVKTATLTSKEITSEADKAEIKAQFMKLKFKPNNPGNVKKGEVFSGTYVWELKTK